MLTIGDKFPDFRLSAVVDAGAGGPFQEVTEQSYPGKWKLVFFWPMDFTFVCPTEIRGFQSLLGEFARDGVVVIGASTDSFFSHQAWLEDRKTFRAPITQGIVRSHSVNDLSVGRSPAEVLRTVQALQSGGLCAADWRKGEEFVA